MVKIAEKFRGTYFISSIALTTAVGEFALSSIFILFTFYVLHFSMDLSAESFSCYYGIAYLLPILIGYISDKYLSKTESATIGIISMIISQLFLAYCASLYYPSDIKYANYFFNIQNLSFFIGLSFLALGTSFTNLSITHIINSINSEKSIVEAFTIYYPILNFGIMLGGVITTTIIGASNYHLYQWAFLFIAAILTIGLIAFRLLKNKFLVDNEGNPMDDSHSRDSIEKESIKLLKKVSSKSVSQIKKLNIRERQKLFNKSITSHEKERLYAFLIFLLIIIFYRTTYSQTGTSMVYFIDAFVMRDYDFYIVPVQLFTILNPIFILVLSPLLIKFNRKIDERNIELGFIKRTIISILLLILCFSLLSVLGYLIDTGVVEKISLIWIFLVEFLLAISELFFLVSGYSMIGHLAPEKYYSIFLGLFIATRSISAFLSGIITTVFPENMNATFFLGIPIDGFMGYFSIFVILNLVALSILLFKRHELTERMKDENSQKA